MKLTRTALLFCSVWVVLLAGLGLVRATAAASRHGPALVSAQPDHARTTVAAGRNRRRPGLARAGHLAGRRAARSSLRMRHAQLVESLQSNPQFRLVANGEMSLDSDSRRVAGVSLSAVADTGCSGRSTRSICTQSCRNAARDLSSPAGAFLEPWLPRDPTLELLKVLQRWQPMQEPNRQFDVWFDRRGRARACCWRRLRPRRSIRISNASPSMSCNRPSRRSLTGDDNMKIDGQRRRQILGADGRAHSRRSASARRGGDGRNDRAAADRVSQRRQRGAQCVAAGERRVAGTRSGQRALRQVHGITLAFGFTLIGVAQDYPIHLLSHRHATRSPVAVGARAVADARDGRGEHVHRVSRRFYFPASSGWRSSRASRSPASPSPA